MWLLYMGAMAETEEISKRFKDLPIRILTSRIKEREAIFNELHDVLAKNDIPGGFVKGLCKLLHHVLHRYVDSKSRRLVENLIRTMMTYHYDAALKSLLALFKEISTSMKNLSATSNTARTSLRALSWSTCFALVAFKKTSPASLQQEFAEIVETQCMFLGAIVASGNEGLIRKATHKFSIIWKQVPDSVSQYADVIAAKDPNFYSVIFASVILKHMGDGKENSNVSKYKVPFLEAYIKVVISSKTKPPLFVLNNDKNILKYVTHEEFKQTLLPALQKAMLRNPEVILESVGCVLADLSIDLSNYALNLGKTLTTYLHSKDESTRDDAATACTYLAQQCSDAEAIQEVLQHLFAVLNGSEGKLTVTGQRMSMFTGIGNFVNNTVTGSSSHQLACFVTKEFIALLQSEVHEGTLVHMLTILSLWCAKYTNEVPSELMDWFPKALNLKTSTAAVRNGYMMCMNTAFNSNNLGQAQELVPLLLRMVEKAAAQPLQHAIVSEGLVASYLLLRLVACNIISDTKLGNFWNIVVDMEKQVFVSEKFMSVASEDVLFYVVLMVERLIVDHPQRLNHPEPLYRALIVGLTHPSLRLRRQCQTLVRKLLMQLGSSSLACSLVTEFELFVNGLKVPELDQDNDCNNGDGNLSLRGNYLADCLMCIVSGTYADPSDSEKLALATLVCSHHPCIVSETPQLWMKLLQRLKVIPFSFIKKNSAEIVEKITKEMPVIQSATNAVQTLVLLNVSVMTIMLEKIFGYLNDDQLLLVTNEEYAIFQTPEGELYDKSVIENAKDDTVINKNIKRESKAYSYRDQLEEIELRKEIEAKKKAKGMITEPEYTTKQQEAIKAQLAKEMQVRATIKQLHQQVVSATSLIKASILGNPDDVICYIPKMIELILPTFQSPVAAHLTTNSYLDLMPVVLDDDMRSLGALISHTALRMLKPHCVLDKAWEDEDVDVAARRSVKLLHKMTVKVEEEEAAFGTIDEPEITILTAPAFAYCFPLLKCILHDAKESVQDDHQTIIQALEIIAEHVHMRANSPDDLAHPQHLPRKEMMQLLIHLIGTTTGRIQQLACSVFLDVALCASGLEGTAEATQDEITILLDAMQSHLLAIREVALQSLAAFILILPTVEGDRENGFRVVQRVWVARFDTSEDIQNQAEKLWNEACLDLEVELSEYLLKDVIHPETVVREAAAAALAAFLETHDDQLESVLQKLTELYRQKLVLPPPVLDNFGRIVSDKPLDDWEPRSGIGLAIGKLAPMFKEEMLSQLMNFFVKEGLGDRHAEVQKNMLEAALATVDAHGKETVNSLLPVFEQFLDKAPNKASYDSVRQSVIVLMGALARHLDKDDPKVKPIVKKLVESLSTPSQQVQEAVANCLPPLVPAIKDESPALVKKLLKLLLESSSYGERKGASYGLAGLVKGLGILALKQLDIITTLTEAIQDKKNARHREGALFAFEQLCNMLGRLFEPYIVHVLPHLLLCFGDQNHHVRQATDDTAKAVMSKLSVHGVKMVLPSLLAALEEDSWRTKTGSIELLGAMAFCAPKQLSSCLPSIVPKLIEILSDSHVKVQKAGNQALKLIGSVIRNPEIQAIVPTLLDALQDPSKKTAMCLQTLLDTKFVHFIDAPSLALIMPVVQRAFQDRSTETRKMAAQIIGNMYSLTDHKDLAPYLPHVLPGLKQSLLDPVPEVRSVSARALGAMVRGMGENNFEDLLPWLMQTLTSEQSSVDRSGAAQGLSEVVGGLGSEKLHKLMPDIIAMAERSDIAPHVKDGYIMMFIYMPVVFQKEFTPYIGSIINPILKALADENEYVRDTALRAGQRIVNMYAESAITLLLPELEKGLFDDNWRIRYSSVQLLGDLLYKISGVSGKMSTETADEDDNFGTEHSHKAILGALGAERRNRVLAGLYMGRSDVALMVRQAALHVWKVVVTNTPRTLREILPTLFSLLLGCLASTSLEKRQVAARTLGDLVRKLGERVLPEIIPILEKGLESKQADQRQGVCIGLGEIMSSTNKDMVLTFVDSLVPTVRKALCDPLPEVRHAAAKTFDSLHSTVGVRALDDILPSLLRQLDDPVVGEYTLDGLRQVMTIKSRVVLPYLVPQLTSSPVNTKALSILASVAGDALTKHLHKILPALLSALSAASGKPNEQQELEYCQTVVLSVTDTVGVRTMMDEFIEETRSDSVEMRRAAVALLYAFCLNTKADYQQYVPQLFRGLIHLFTDKDERVLHLSWEALNAVTKKLDAPEVAQHVANVRQAVRFAVSDLKGQELLPGFCLPKGITPILPIFREAILNGPPELKEQAAQGLGEVIRLTSAEALKPSVVHITGPLIRILGDRFNWNVKVAVLDALALLLAKVGAMLKAFLPQLQTTFLKALSDPNRQVRLKAGAALSHLIVIHTRVDPLFTELHVAVKNTDDSAIRETMLQALRVIIIPSGDKVGDTVRKMMMQTLLGLLSFHEDMSRMAAAGCIGALCQWLPEEELCQFVNEHLLDDDASADRNLRHGRSVALIVALKEAPMRILKDEWLDKITKVLMSLLTADRVPLALNGVRGIGYFLKYQIKTNRLTTMPLIGTFAKSMNHSSNEVKQLVAQVSHYLAKSFDALLPDILLKPLLPMLVNGTKEKNTMVKANSEFALVAILKLRQHDETYVVCLNLLDSGAREAMGDVINKVLRKVANQPEPKEEDFDDTLLT